MKMIHRLTCASAFLAASLFGASQTWMGQITDSVCAQYHPSQGPGQKGEESDLPTRRACTLQCVKNGADFVFVSGEGKIFQIAKQDSPDLKQHAGEKVKLIGTLAGDTITVTSIETQN